MKKIYLSLVIVLASLIMANEANAQQYFAIDNQRSDDVRVRIYWQTCGTFQISNYDVCANSSLMVNIPIFDAVLRYYQTNQLVLNTCGTFTTYRIGSPVSNWRQCATICNDYTPKLINLELFNGIFGGLPVGQSLMNYQPGGTFQGTLTLKYL